MRSARLYRTETSAQGTFGLLETDDGEKYCTGELPWRLNEQGKSCIPPGSYVCKLQPSAHFKRKLYHLQDVPGRTDVMIHSGNFCGDADQGFKSDVLGCILEGESVGDIDGQRAVLRSADALADFMAGMDGEDFTLEVAWAPGVGPQSGAGA